MKNTVLTKNELLGLFDSSITNAKALFDIAFANYQKDETAHISLGLCELALEELGKSYTCLAYYCLSEKQGNHWVDFWKDWKDHKTKAHRAFFYEFFCLVRLEITGLVGYHPTKRESIQLEKEISFYVDFDHRSRKVLIPLAEIDKMEIYNRIGSLIGPFNSAYKVRDLINLNKQIDYRMAISNYSLMTLTTNMYQQNVKEVLDSLKNSKIDYDRALNDIWIMFNPEK